MANGRKSNRSHWPIAILSTLSSIFNMLLPLVLVRMLTQNEVGMFKVFFLYLAISPAFAMTAGLMSGLGYWAGQEDRRGRAIQVSYLIVLILAFVLFSIALGFHVQLADRFGWTEEQAWIFAFALLGAISAHFFEEAAIATGHIWGGALFFAGFEFVRTIAILCVAYTYHSLTAILITHTIIISVKVLLGLILAHRLELFRVTFDPLIAKAVARYALPVSVAWTFGIFVSSADQILLSAYIAPADFAIYSIGCLMIPPILILEQSITRVLIPQLSQAFARGEFMYAAELYKDAMEKLAFLIVPAVVGLAIFADPIISLLFTSRYAEASVYLQVFALTYLRLILPFDAVARARGKAGWILKTFIIFSAITLAATFSGIKLAGAMGALLAVILSDACMRMYSIAYMRREASWRIPDFIPLGPLAVMGTCGVVFGAAMIPMRDLFASDLAWFLTCGPIFSALYLGVAAAVIKRMELRSREKHTVLMLTQCLEIGGLERMVLHLCVSLKANGDWSPRVFAYDQPEDSGGRSLIPEFERAGIPVEAFRKQPGFSLKAVFRATKTVFLNHVSVIHCQDLGSLIYAVFVKLICFGQIKIVHTQHSFIHLDREKRYQAYERFFTKFVDELVVVSEDTRRTYVDLGFDAQRVHLVSNGVAFPDSPAHDRAALIERRRPFVAELPDGAIKTELAGCLEQRWLVYLARLFPRKGQDRVLELWRELTPEERSKCRLLLVGPEAQAGERARIEALVASAPDSAQIVLFGGTNEPQRWLSMADVYISSSEFEGMPLGPLEAVGSGLPVLLSQIPGHDFLRETSYQYSLDRPADGAAHLREILRSAERSDFRTMLWHRSDAVRAAFSIQEMTREYERIYASALGWSEEKGELQPARLAAAL